MAFTFVDFLLTLISYIFLMFMGWLGGWLVQSLSFGSTIPFTNKRFGPFLKRVKIPPLLGMILACCIIANIKGGYLFQKIHGNNEANGIMRNVALTVILFKAGLGLDLGMLQKQKGGTLRLTALPLVFESTVIGLLGYWLFGMDIILALAMGCMCSAVSPAVVVQALAQLESEGYGVTSGIHTLILAAASLDDVLAINMFLLCCGLRIADEHNPIQHYLGSYTPLVMAVVQVIVGIGLGVGFGQYLKRKVKWNRRIKFGVLIGITTVLCGGFIAIEHFYHIELLSAGFLTIITMNAILSSSWDPDSILFCSQTAKKIWGVLCILLFGLVGEQTRFEGSVLEDLLFYLIILLVGSVIVRSLTAYVSSIGCNFNLREKVFVAVSWLPKATVQAALCGAILDKGGEEWEDEGTYALMIGVLSIILTAPVGAILIATLGPLWLEKCETHQMVQEGDFTRKHHDDAEFGIDLEGIGGKKDSGFANILSRIYAVHKEH